MPSPIPGQILIISSPSGGGKTTICRKLLSPRRRRQGWRFSVSYTTRKRRPGEREGREYHFVSEQQFDQCVTKDFFAEHFQVHLARYGTPRRPLEEVKGKGGVMVLDVDVNGARNIKREYPDAITVFVLPPSIAALRRRLKQRGTETKEQLKLRFKNAIQEMSTFRDYGFDYVVVNKDIDTAVEDVLAIVRAETHRVSRLTEGQLGRLLG